MLYFNNFKLMNIIDNFNKNINYKKNIIDVIRSKINLVSEV